MKSHKDDPVAVRLTPDEAIEKPEPTEPGEPAEPDRMFRLDRTEEATIIDHPGRPDGETVFAGHGYHIGGRGWVEVPAGTSIVFYTKDGERLDDTPAFKLETGALPVEKKVEIAPPGSHVPDYVLTYPYGLTVSSSSRIVDRDTSLRELLQPGMGRVHWAACRQRLDGIP